LFPAGKPARRVVKRAGRAPSSSIFAAADVGIAHHKFLEHVKLEQTLDAVSLQREAQRLGNVRVLLPEEIAALDFKALAAFWDSDVGRKIREAAQHVRRELAFTARFSPQELAAITGEEFNASLADEFVVVQGVADLVVFLPREIWLVDFKTDDIQPGEVAAKAKLYEAQLKLYAQALARIYQRPVRECWLHFLALRQTIRIQIAGRSTPAQGELFSTQWRPTR
jgi:ATP-dependent helicase/nuclease subunit A